MCNKLVKLVSKSKSLDSVYFSTSAWKSIGLCSGTLVVDESVQVIEFIVNSFSQYLI